ncbi:MAG: hypothetical protein GY830_09825, partial [Bacteroidetes bacterium]|nr:hypothetical protein [Bacteroidota bacterium]
VLKGIHACANKGALKLSFGVVGNKNIKKLFSKLDKKFGGKSSGGNRNKAGGSIKTIPKNVIKNTEEFVKSATKSDRNGLSKLGRGLQKHSSRKGSAFKDVKFSHKNADQIGEKILRNILNSKDKTIQKLPNGTTNIFDKNTGRGVNISREGLFNGFRDQF